MHGWEDRTAVVLVFITTINQRDVTVWCCIILFFPSIILSFSPHLSPPLAFALSLSIFLFLSPAQTHSPLKPHHYIPDDCACWEVTVNVLNRRCEIPFKKHFQAFAVPTESHLSSKQIGQTSEWERTTHIYIYLFSLLYFNYLHIVTTLYTDIIWHLKYLYFFGHFCECIVYC